MWVAVGKNGVAGSHDQASCIMLGPITLAKPHKTLGCTRSALQCEGLQHNQLHNNTSITLRSPSPLPRSPCLCFPACPSLQTLVARPCTMLQHRLSGCRSTAITTSGRRAAVVSAPARAPLRICCSAAGLSAVHGPSFESLDSDDLISPLATGVREHAVHSSFSVVSTHRDQNREHPDKQASA